MIVKSCGSLSHVSWSNEASDSCACQLLYFVGVVALRIEFAFISVHIP